MLQLELSGITRQPEYQHPQVLIPYYLVHHDFLVLTTYHLKQQSNSLSFSKSGNYVA